MWPKYNSLVPLCLTLSWRTLLLIWVGLQPGLAFRVIDELVSYDAVQVLSYLPSYLKSLRTLCIY